MKLRTFSTEGIVLAKRNFGEADRIFSIYTKDYGRLSLIGKGVRKPGSRKRGHLEVFNKIKFSAVATKGIDLITEAEIIEIYPEIRKKLNKVSLAYYFTEVIGRTTHEKEVNNEVFFLLEDYLGKLTKETKLKKLRTDFIFDALVILGFWPKSRKLINPDETLKEVVERNISSQRVGKRILS
jgi:DNA repair protein RecO (recombination protein O)